MILFLKPELRSETWDRDFTSLVRKNSHIDRVYWSHISECTPGKSLPLLSFENIMFVVLWVVLYFSVSLVAYFCRISLLMLWPPECILFRGRPVFPFGTRGHPKNCVRVRVRFPTTPPPAGRPGILLSPTFLHISSCFLHIPSYLNSFILHISSFFLHISSDFLHISSFFLRLWPPIWALELQKNSELSLIIEALGLGRIPNLCPSK